MWRRTGLQRGETESGGPSLGSSRAGATWDTFTISVILATCLTRTMWATSTTSTITKPTSKPTTTTPTATPTTTPTVAAANTREGRRLPALLSPGLRGPPCSRAEGRLCGKRRVLCLGPAGLLLQTTPQATMRREPRATGGGPALTGG